MKKQESERLAPIKFGLPENPSDPMEGAYWLGNFYINLGTKRGHSLTSRLVRTTFGIFYISVSLLLLFFAIFIWSEEGVEDIYGFLLKLILTIGILLLGVAFFVLGMRAIWTNVKKQ